LVEGKTPLAYLRWKQSWDSSVSELIGYWQDGQDSVPGMGMPLHIQQHQRSKGIKGYFTRNKVAKLKLTTDHHLVPRCNMWKFISTWLVAD
jgi:hypothetical protein